jgi:hypothetical protein
MGAAGIPFLPQALYNILLAMPNPPNKQQMFRVREFYHYLVAQVQLPIILNRWQSFRSDLKLTLLQNLAYQRIAFLLVNVMQNQIADQSELLEFLPLPIIPQINAFIANITPKLLLLQSLTEPIRILNNIFQIANIEPPYPPIPGPGHAAQAQYQADLHHYFNVDRPAWAAQLQAAVLPYNNLRPRLITGAGAAPPGFDILARWNNFNNQEKQNLWGQLNDREQTVIYDAILQQMLAPPAPPAPPVSLQNAINDAFDPAQAIPAAQVFANYIDNNQPYLTRRYGFAIPNNDTSYLYRHVEVPIGEDQGMTRGACNPKIFGMHAHNICEATTNALAYVINELIQNQKYMQAGEQLLNCISARLRSMIEHGGGDDDHRRVVGVLLTLQEIINQVGIQNIGALNVRGANLNITLNAGQALRFRAVTFPNGVRTLAGVAGAPGAGADRGVVRFVGNPYFPGQYRHFDFNVAGGKRRKTRHAKKSKKSKTRKH